MLTLCKLFQKPDTLILVQNVCDLLLATRVPGSNHLLYNGSVTTSCLGTVLGNLTHVRAVI